jgi:hypothetical protein
LSKGKEKRPISRFSRIFPGILHVFERKFIENFTFFMVNI